MTCAVSLAVMCTAYTFYKEDGLFLLTAIKDTQHCTTESVITLQPTQQRSSSSSSSDSCSYYSMIYTRTPTVLCSCSPSLYVALSPKSSSCCVVQQQHAAMYNNIYRTASALPLNSHRLSLIVCYVLIYTFDACCNIGATV
jgi:hypothetical protein